MGYRIVYGPDSPKKIGEGNRFLRFQMMTAAFFLLGCVLARMMWPEGLAILRDVLLPGDFSVTEQAFLNLSENLRAGEPMGEAVETFCRYVITYGTPN